MSTSNSPAKAGKSLLMAILIAGLIAGTLDGSAAVINYMIQGGKKPESIFKYIASALFGKKAYTSGNSMVAWGILFHFFIAMSWTAIFFLLFPKVKWIQQNVILAGLIYGIVVWILMTQVVVKLSMIPNRPFNMKNAIINVLILMVCIGLPVSLLAKKHYLYRK